MLSFHENQSDFELFSIIKIVCVLQSNTSVLDKPFGFKVNNFHLYITTTTFRSYVFLETTLHQRVKKHDEVIGNKGFHILHGLRNAALLVAHCSPSLGSDVQFSGIYFPRPYLETRSCNLVLFVSRSSVSRKLQFLGS